jgi:hypothetical protein
LIDLQLIQILCINPQSFAVAGFAASMMHEINRPRPALGRAKAAPAAKMPASGSRKSGIWSCLRFTAR